MSYTVTRRGAKSIVKFSCTKCGTPLESPLEEANKRFPCPNCGEQFVTPGAEELKKLREDNAERAAREAEAEANARAVHQEERRLAAARVAQNSTNDEEDQDAQRGLHRPTPKYDGITVGAGILRILCVLTWIGALIIIVQAAQHADSVQFVAGASAVISGALIWMVAEVGLAIRDIARNSFRK